MSNWMLRGLVFGAAMVVVRLFQGTLISVWQTHAGLISIVLLVLFIVGVVAGRSGCRAGQRRGDLADLGVLPGAVRRWPDQRADHVRGLHRPGGVPGRDQRGCHWPLAG